jgi:alpha,alpha-trehalase
MAKQGTQLGPQFTAERMRPPLEYIDRFWKKLERFSPHDDGTLVGLPSPYFVPSVDFGGGHHFEEMYYWDSYFTALGFLGTPREHLIRGMCENLLAMMERFHIIPNSGRTYHTGRSHPPFLTSMIMMVYRIELNKRWLDHAMSVAKEEYRSVWMGVSHPNWRQVFHGLSRNYDINVLDDLAECESGWDMTTRFERQALSYLPVDLNALLYRYEQDFEQAAEILGEPAEAHEWRKRALARKNTMQKYLWDERRGFWFDYNYMQSRFSPVWSMAGFFPMWAGIDDGESAGRIMKHLDKFEYAGGLVATAKEGEPEMDMPTQWAYPNGWAPLHLIAIEAMERYDYHIAAERIARKWLESNLVMFEEKGEFLEKYNMVDIHKPPKDGVYPLHVGFGWTNAIFERLAHIYLRADELPEIKRVTGTELSPLGQLVRNPRKTLRRVGVKLNLNAVRDIT